MAMNLKIMVVEDDAGQRDIIRESVEVYERDKGRKVEVEYCEDVEDALDKINGTFDGAIVDLKLKDQPEGGNTIVQEMEGALFRVPVIFVTGHPDLVINREIVIRRRAREERTYSEDFDEFFDIYQTGLTKIMGGRGIIEKTLNDVFVKNLLPQRQAWIAHGQDDAARTEKALLRFALNHLMQLLDDDEHPCFPEEVYIYPPLHGDLKTGSIVENKENRCLSVVLTPACDLYARKGGAMKTDRILLVEIDNVDKGYGYLFRKYEKLMAEAPNDAEKALVDSEKNNTLMSILTNRYAQYHHWLPMTSFFPGGFINFRKVNSLNKKECLRLFNAPHIQISPHFVKDILSRFSSYYARQGQPDLDITLCIKDINGAA